MTPKLLMRTVVFAKCWSVKEGHRLGTEEMTGIYQTPPKEEDEEATSKGIKCASMKVNHKVSGLTGLRKRVEKHNRRFVNF